MPAVSIAFGFILTALGVFFYYPEKVAATAFIPAYFGIALIVLGLFSYQDGLRKHLMHVAALVGLLACVVPAARIGPVLGDYFTDTAFDPHKANAIRAQALMAVIALVFMLLCVNSFIEARRARRQSS